MEAPSTTCRPSRVAVWIGYVISGLLVLVLLADGIMKIVQPAFIVDGAAQAGISLGVMRGIGIALVASTVLYAIPMTNVLGAILLVGYMGGAVYAHLQMGDPVATILPAILFGVLVWLGLVLRDPEVLKIAPLRCRHSCGKRTDPKGVA